MGVTSDWATISLVWGGTTFPSFLRWPSKFATLITPLTIAVISICSASRTFSACLSSCNLQGVDLIVGRFGRCLNLLHRGQIGRPRRPQCRPAAMMPAIKLPRSKDTARHECPMANPLHMWSGSFFGSVEGIFDTPFSRTSGETSTAPVEWPRKAGSRRAQEHSEDRGFTGVFSRFPFVLRHVRHQRQCRSRSLSLGATCATKA